MKFVAAIVKVVGRMWLDVLGYKFYVQLHVIKGRAEDWRDPQQLRLNHSQDRKKLQLLKFAVLVCLEFSYNDLGPQLEVSVQQNNPLLILLCRPSGTHRLQSHLFRPLHTLSIIFHREPGRFWMGLHSSCTVHCNKVSYTIVCVISN